MYRGTSQPTASAAMCGTLTYSKIMLARVCCKVGLGRSCNFTRAYASAKLLGLWPIAGGIGIDSKIWSTMTISVSATIQGNFCISSEWGLLEQVYQSATFIDGSDAAVWVPRLHRPHFESD